MNQNSRSRWITCGSILLACLVVLGLLVVTFIVNNIPPKVTVSRHKMPKNNAWDDFVKAGEMVKKINHPGPLSSTRSASSWTIPEYESFVRDNAPALDIFRRGLKKPYMHPCCRSSKEMPYSRYVGLRELARILAGEAYYYDSIGMPDKAMNSLLDGVELGITFPRGGVIITEYVGVALQAISMDSMHALISKLDADELDYARARMEHIVAKRWPLSEVVLEEGRFNTTWFTDSFHDPEAQKDIRDPRNWVRSGYYNPLADDETWPDKGKLAWWSGRFAFANKRVMLQKHQDYYRALAAELRQPYRLESRVPVPSDPVFDQLAPVFQRAACAHARINTKFALIQTEVALRRYNFDHNRYPSHLSQLVPTYLRKTPEDPFGLGKPLKYKVLNGGKDFQLYSIGFDQKDNHGKRGNWDDSDIKGDLLLR